MTFDDYKQSGKSGWYCAERDEWFLDGETPPPLTKPVKAAAPAPEPELKPEPAAPEAALKTSKGAKHHAN